MSLAVKGSRKDRSREEIWGLEDRVFKMGEIKSSWNTVGMALVERGNNQRKKFFRTGECD